MADIPVKDLPEASSVDWGSLMMISDTSTDETYRTTVNTISTSVSSVTASGTISARILEATGAFLATDVDIINATTTETFTVKNLDVGTMNTPATHVVSEYIRIKLDVGHSFKVITPGDVPGMEITEDGDITW